MKQVKMMSNSNLYILEDNVNEFLIRCKKVINIKYQVVQDFNDYNCWNYSVMITYEEVGIDIPDTWED